MEVEKACIRKNIVALTCSNHEKTLMLLHFTKSLKRDIDKILYLWTPEEPYCLISTS